MRYYVGLAPDRSVSSRGQCGSRLQPSATMLLGIGVIIVISNVESVPDPVEATHKTHQSSNFSPSDPPPEFLACPNLRSRRRD